MLENPDALSAHLCHFRAVLVAPPGNKHSAASWTRKGNALHAVLYLLLAPVLALLAAALITGGKT